MFHYDCYHDGCSSGSILGGLRRLSRHSRAAQSTPVLHTVAWLRCDSHDFAHLSISLMCWCSSGSLLGLVLSPLFFRNALLSTMAPMAAVSIV